eukprot:4745399-Pyramimonas_sp.AAC.1
MGSPRGARSRAQALAAARGEFCKDHGREVAVRYWKLCEALAVADWISTLAWALQCPSSGPRAARERRRAPASGRARFSRMAHNRNVVMLPWTAVNP